MSDFIRTGRGIGLGVVVVTDHAKERVMDRWGPEDDALGRLTACLRYGSIQGRTRRDTLVRYGDTVAILRGQKVVTVVKVE